METAEGEYTARRPQHALARVGHHWRQDPQGNDYVARLPLTATRPEIGSSSVETLGTEVQLGGQVILPQKITVRYLAAMGRLHLRGLTLIDERTDTFVPLTVSTSGGFRLVHSGDVKVYENLDVLPRAFAVHQVQIADDDKMALALLQDPAFDPAVSVVLAAETSPPELPSDRWAVGDDTVSVARYDPEQVVVEADLSNEGYLVLSDTYYPGWRVKVNGAESHIHRANLSFRAVYLPAGQHTLEFRFQPNSLRVGACVSALMAVTTALSLVALKGRRGRSNPKTEPPCHR